MNILAQMKKRIHNKIVIAVAALLTAGTYSFAQAPAALEQRKAIESEYGVREAVIKYDTRAEMMTDKNLLGGEYYMYPSGDVKITSAPKGYKPVYISHIGRHGARYGLGDGVYEAVRNVLSDAHAAGKLTVAGEDLYSRYEKFYPTVANRGGDLTIEGQKQHRFIATMMYKEFPEVFKGKTRAAVLSTAVPRVMLSMMSFVDELRGLDRDLAYSVDAGRVYLPVLEPDGGQNPFRVKTQIPAEAKASSAALQTSLIDPKAFCSRYFNDTDYVESKFGMWQFESNLRTVVVGMQCLDGEQKDTFSDIFTFDELFGIWEVRNYNGYLYMGRSPLTDNFGCTKNAAILENMIEEADEDLASGEVQLRLRFSHDTAILPLVSYMRLDNFGAVVDDPKEVKNYWRSDKVPMAANLQLIFYRSKRSPEILVKVLYNGHEASLPIPQVAPSFYSWTAFKEYYGK